MKHLMHAIFLTTLLFITCCQRNSNDLPTTNVLFTKTIFSSLNNAQLDAYFTEHVGFQPYALTVHFMARPGVYLTKPRILILQYVNYPSYNTVVWTSLDTVATLNSTTISPEFAVSTNLVYPIDTSNIQVYLVGDSAANGLLYSGYYMLGMVKDTMTNSSVSEYSAWGYIDAGGNACIYMNDDSMRIITGILADSTDFLNGNISPAALSNSANNISYKVANFSSSTSALTFQLMPTSSIPTAGSNIKTLTFYLKNKK